MNRDMTYCKGKNCALAGSCKRFVRGGEIPIREQDLYWWIDHCDEEMREGYWKL